MGELNTEQLLAVKAVDGPVIVFAGAGSGKTRTLTYRIAHMITHEKIRPYNILAITFTNKATNEMKERLKTFLDVESDGVTISTFHSLCALILRREIEILGYSKSFTILDEEDQLKVIADVLKDMNEEKSRAKGVQKSINYNKCFMTIPSDPSYPIITKVYEKYEEKMKTLNTLDFEDLLIKVYEIFSKYPEVLLKYQNKYKYILVDEFQDTNLIQYKIVKLLAMNHHNLFVVGDDDQSIYSFRGTNYENVSLFKEDFPEYQLFTLCENYRSTQSILDCANRLIKYNKNREPKKMICSNTGDIDDVVVYQAENELDEVDFIIQNIFSLKRERNDYSDFAVLYRSSVLLRNIELGLIRRNIPYKVYGGVSYLKRREVKDIISYFRLFLDNDSILDFRRVVNIPSRGIGNVTIDKIESIRKTYKLSILEAINWSETVISPKRYAELKRFMELINHYTERIKNDSLIEIFDDLLKDIDYNGYLKSECDAKEAEERLANLIEFKSILYTIETKTTPEERKARMREIFDDATLSDDHLQTQKESPNGVTLSTIHSVKGLEFSYVFLIGLEEDIFPNTSRIIRDDELEEERRIAYVAITRAKKKIFMTLSKKRLLYGHFFMNKPSRFLLEAIGAKNIDKYDDITDITKDNEALTKKQISTKEIKTLESEVQTNVQDGEYKISDVVIHKVFGEGIILGINKGIGNIFFKDIKSSKNILLSHPSIKKK